MRENVPALARDDLQPDLFRGTVLRFLRKVGFIVFDLVLPAEPFS
jgi:hypothetical protein